MMPNLAQTTSQAIYTVEQVRKLEQLALKQSNCSLAALMQRAGEAVFNTLTQLWPYAKHITVFCGIGNNGGDGYIAALLAHLHGLQVSIIQLGDPQRLSGLALAAQQNCLRAGMICQPWQSNSLVQADVIIDAIFGSGLQRAVTETWAEAITAINAANIPVLAVDIPSGLHADTGACLGNAVKADTTISFVGLKPGLVTGEGPAHTGKLLCHSLELPAHLYQQVEVVAQTLALKEEFFQPRSPTAHKGQFGHVLVVGGDYGMSGAVRLAGEAAARVGAGLVTIATRQEHVTAVVSARPELLCYGVNTSADLEPLIEKATVIIIGPGLGQTAWGQELLVKVLAASIPTVMDADALNLLARQVQVKDNWVLTPHPGEAARLLSCKTADIQINRLTAAKQLQQRYGGTLVLKGAGTIIQSQANQSAICTAGNPGMASGGMGDVLSGVIGGLIAQGLPLTIAAEQGVLIHAMAADQAASEGMRGMLALDLIAQLRPLVNTKTLSSGLPRHNVLNSMSYDNL